MPPDAEPLSLLESLLIYGAMIIGTALCGWAVWFVFGTVLPGMFE